jgi:hypothetical protein
MHTLDDDRIQRIFFNPQRSVAAAWNYALDHLFETVGHVLVVNNDVELLPETYRMLEGDGGLFVTAVGVSDRRQIEGVTLDPDNTRPHPDFSCFLIRREVWGRGLRFDEAYKGAYCEDAEMHLALHRAHIPAYAIGVPFYHVASATVKHCEPEEQRRIQQLADQNRKLFQERHGVEVGSPQYYDLFQNSYTRV